MVWFLHNPLLPPSYHYCLPNLLEHLVPSSYPKKNIIAGSDIH